MLTDLRKPFFLSPNDRLFSCTANNLNSLHQKLLNIFILAMIKKNGIANSKIRPLWQALIILNYGVISTYYFERNNVLMCLLHVSLMAGSRTLRVRECPRPDTRCDGMLSLQWVVQWEKKNWTGILGKKRCDGTWYSETIIHYATWQYFDIYGKLT